MTTLTTINPRFAHPFNIIVRDLDDAFARGYAFIEESNTVGYDGIPATSFEVAVENGVYGTYYRVAFEAAYTVVAGVRFDNPACLALAA